MDECDEISLPSDTLKILHEFLQEKQKREEDEQHKIENKLGKEATFEENWQLSQFWYSKSTKKILSSVVRKLVDNATKDNFKIALLSCPSLYCVVKETHPNVKIFEYDKRFSAYGDDFIFYDINEAITLTHLQDEWNSFDLIIADPPFLSEECIIKISEIITNLGKDNSKIIFCSGATVETWLIKYLNLKKCRYRPEHERNLGNEFATYANFELDNFIEL
ncbi:protein-lysine N-methyltransferase CG9154 [Teleopsis dalmanni]|uniref:protein-lysine N-methyltransferase CG9154 n=1 Tax=Teleopsis dalmanni TaxID=139649 RepID=UPI000D329996|nr:protein-lysine N-methyltransferase CG9154 [Teleopsis dalmanni]